jgi:hypothetical protein
MAPRDPTIVAVASDDPPAAGVPWFRRDDIAGIADFVIGTLSR